ncbi:MAG TPA: type II toxin-antitoxin system VapC family toxin [bacterium]|nr:type II toxin-antitoxin system VapC family toxin [bacterium]
MFASIDPPLQTCEAVISEACFLVKGIPGGAQAIFGLLDRGVLELSFRLGPNQSAIQAMMARYANVPMSVADACLVRMAELDPKSAILTLDSDFKVYRKHGRQVVPVAMPDAV